MHKQDILIINTIDDKSEIKVSKLLDTTGKLFPDLIVDINRIILRLKVGEIAGIIATDSAVKSCIPTWCENTGHLLIQSHFDKEYYKYHYIIKRMRKYF